MDRMLDRICLTLGHPLPVPARWLLGAVGWALLLMAVLSLFPSEQAAFQAVLRDAGVDLTLPRREVIVPVFIGLTLLQLIHAQMVVRRRALLAAARGEPAPGDALMSAPTPRLTPARLWGFGLVVTLLFGYVLWRWM